MDDSGLFFADAQHTQRTLYHYRSAAEGAGAQCRNNTMDMVPTALGNCFHQRAADIEALIAQLHARGQELVGTAQAYSEALLTQVTEVIDNDNAHAHTFERLAGEQS